MVNLEPNLRKLSISQLDMRSSDEHIEQLAGRTTASATTSSSATASWLGVVKREPNVDPATGQADAALQPTAASRHEPYYGGVLQGDFGCSTKFKTTGRQQAVPGARRHRHPDVLGDGDDGARSRC